MFDMTIIEGLNDPFSMVFSNALSQLLEELQANLLHDLKVGTFGDFSNDLN